MPDVIISANTLRKSYTTHGTTTAEVLRGVSLDIYRGEILAIVGSSGAGKSTLLHLLAALDEPDDGTILFSPDGKQHFVYPELDQERLAQLRNEYFGFIFQFHHLLPEFTALENVIIPALIRGIPQKQSRQRAEELLQNLGLPHRLHHKPDELSGGEQQRIAFARAMMNQPALVFADEPTGNLDAHNTRELILTIQSARQNHGQTFVIVTHSSELAQSADRIITLRNGLLDE